MLQYLYPCWLSQYLTVKFSFTKADYLHMNRFCIQYSWARKTFFLLLSFFLSSSLGVRPQERNSLIMAPILSGITSASYSPGCVAHKIQSPSSSYMLECLFGLTVSPQGWGRQVWGEALDGLLGDPRYQKGVTHQMMKQMNTDSIANKSQDMSVKAK